MYQHRARISIVLLAAMLFVTVFGGQTTSATDAEKAEVGVIYLGRGSLPNLNALDPSEENWGVGDEFWVGVYVKDLSAISEKLTGSNGGIFATAAALEYSSQYMTLVSTSSDISSALGSTSNWNKNGYTVSAVETDVANLGVSSLPENSAPKAVYASIKHGGRGTRLYTGTVQDTPLVLCAAKFRIQVFPAEGVPVFSAALNPAQFVFQTGEYASLWSAQWNENTAVTPDENLKNFFRYAGDYSPPLGNVRYNEVRAGQYGESYLEVVSAFANGKLMSELPPGLEYNSHNNVLQGVPTQAGEYVFIIGDQYYKMDVKKAPLTATVQNTTRVYGDPNPTPQFVYSGFIMGDTVRSPSFVNGLEAPSVTCDATAYTPAGSVVELVAGTGNSTNYEITGVSGEMTITKRPLRVASLDSGVPATYQNAKGSALIRNGVASPTNYTSGDLVSGDDVYISYTATYDNSSTPGEVSVKISDVAITEDGRGANYELMSFPTSAQGYVRDRMVTGFTIESAPKSDYTYGETLDFSGLRVQVSFDGGAGQSSFTYDDLYEQGITLEYSGGGVAEDGQRLRVTEHNGKEVRIKADGIAETLCTLKVEPKELAYTIQVATKVYDGSTEGSGTFQFSNLEQGDDVKADAVFTYARENVGLSIPVSVTGIILSGKDARQYSIPDSDSAVGGIRQAIPPAPDFVDAYVDPRTNHIVVNSPSGEGPAGTGYLYTLTGGEPYQTMNEFANLGRNTTYTVHVRSEGSGNYARSAFSPPVTLRTYRRKIDIFEIGKTEAPLYTFYCNNAVVNDEAELLAMFPDPLEGHDGLYLDNDTKSEVEYPFTINDDISLYTVAVNAGGGSAVPFVPTPNRIESCVGGPMIQIELKWNGKEKLLTWSSTNESVVAVNNKGQVWIVGEGDAEIIISCSSGIVKIPVHIEGRIGGLLDTEYSGAYLWCDADGNFYPNRPMTRGEMAVVLDTLLRKEVRRDANGETQQFTDADANSHYYEAVNRLTSLGVFSGYDDGNFHPEWPLTRAAVATMLCRAMELPFSDGPETQFLDLSEEHWAYPYMMELNRRNVLCGYGDSTIHPDDYITRAELASLLSRIIRISDPESDEFIVPPDVVGHWSYDAVIRAVNQRAA